jgi:hypothetical protein
MQTSGNSSSKSGITRVAGAMGLALFITSGWMACSPGEPVCEDLAGLCDKAGEGGSPGTGGMTGSTGGTGVKIDDVPAACGDLGVTGEGDAALKSFETKYIVTKCGTAKCHGNPTVFMPKGMDMPDMIRKTLVNVKSATLCKDDYYVNKTNPAKSFMLMKITADGDTLDCPTTAPGAKPDLGGTRMPNKEGMPGSYGEKLPAGDIECFTWWIENVGKVK